MNVTSAASCSSEATIGNLIWRRTTPTANILIHARPPMGRRSAVKNSSARRISNDMLTVYVINRPVFPHPRAHISPQVHRKARNHECQLCGHRFARRDTLRRSVTVALPPITSADCSLGTPKTAVRRESSLASARTSAYRPNGRLAMMHRAADRSVLRSSSPPSSPAPRLRNHSRITLSEGQTSAPAPQPRLRFTPSNDET